MIENMPENSGFQENLAHLQEESLKAIALFTGAVGYIWLAILLWEVTGRFAPASAWASVLILLAGVFLSLQLRRRALWLASHLLIFGMIAALTAVLLGYPDPAVAYLFVLPIIFTGVLLKPHMLFLVSLLVSLISSGLMISLGAPRVADVIIPISVIAAVTLASWLATRHLYLALVWVWNGYEQARLNEKVARDRQAELYRALKALDETTYKLERTNHMLIVARDLAQEARRLKQQFVQTISHELRTPLNLIVSFSELMIQAPEYYGGQLLPTYLRDLSIVHRNACHLQSLVNDVLDLARIETAQMSLYPEETDPAVLVQEAVNTARGLVEARGLGLAIDIQAGLPRLAIDPLRIRQVLFNLLNNAARYTDRGQISVQAQLDGQKNEVIISVSDTGVGIAPPDLQHIFEEFRQVEAHGERQQSGTGLGLAISKRFVELHGGRIWAESQVGAGSRFFFSLPLQRADGIGAMSEARASGADYALSQWASAESIVLLVTKSPSAASLLTRYLRGCRTVVVNSLEQAHRLAQQLIPQAVVIDSACEPVSLDGLEALSERWGMQSMPFLACPLPGEEPLRQRLDVDSFLIKPVTRASLWNILRQFGEDIVGVLVVSGDRDFGRLLVRLLENPIRRYQVTRAHTTQEALALMHELRPELVLLDLSLKEADSLKFIEQIRSSQRLEPVNIVAVSAQDEIDNLKNLGESMIVTKAEGLMPVEVVQWVQKVVNSTVKPWLSAEDSSELSYSL